jgi:transporter family protein
MNWIWIALVTACFYALYNVLIKLASAHIHQVLGAVILQVTAFVLGILWLVFIRMKGTHPEVSSRGLWLAVLAGVFVGLAEIFSFIVFSKGVPASSGIPVIIGGSVLLAAVIGFLWLKEPLTFSHILGAVLVIAGIWMLSRSPLA